MPICKIRQARITGCDWVAVHGLLPFAPLLTQLKVSMVTAAFCLKVFLLLCASAVNCDDEVRLKMLSTLKC